MQVENEMNKLFYAFILYIFVSFGSPNKFFLPGKGTKLDGIQKKK